MLSVSHICEKRKEVRFISTSCTVVKIRTGEVFLIAKIYKNLYVADFDSIYMKIQTVLSLLINDVELWHRRLGMLMPFTEQVDIKGHDAHLSM